MKFPKLLVVIVTLFSLILTVKTSLAFRVSPTSFEVTLKGGETKTLFLEIGNELSEPIRCRIYPTNYEVGRDGKPIFEGASDRFSALKMIKIKESEVIVSAKGQKKVAILVTLPRGIPGGEYFAAIMSETTSPAQVKTAQGVVAQMMVNLRIGSILRVNVPGRTILKKAEISELRVEMPEKEEGIKIMATLENRCPLHLEAEGEVLIKDAGNRVVEKFLLQGANKEIRGRAFIYPQGSRDFWGIIEKPLPAGKYLAEVSFDYGYRFRKIRKEIAFEISPALGKKQKEWLLIRAEPNLVKLEMKPGALRRENIKILNLDINPLRVVASTKVFTKTNWLKVLPAELTIRGQAVGSLRIIVSLPEDETVKRIGKVLLKPERGKEMSVDIIISEKGGNKK